MQWNLPITMNAERFIEKITSSDTLKRKLFFSVAIFQKKLSMYIQHHQFSK